MEFGPDFIQETNRGLLMYLVLKNGGTVQVTFEEINSLIGRSIMLSVDEMSGVFTLEVSKPLPCTMN